MSARGALRGAVDGEVGALLPDGEVVGLKVEGDELAPRVEERVDRVIRRVQPADDRGGGGNGSRRWVRIRYLF